MARSLCNVKLIYSLAENVSLSISRRGFSAVATTRGRTAESIMKQTTGAGKEAANKEESWVPDPVTGYYRPEKRGDDIDVAELRYSTTRGKTREKAEQRQYNIQNSRN